jgi:riboflavin synthase
VKIGSSICVSGVCLSITALTDATMRFDVTEETLRCTTIGDWKMGDAVNLERAMKVADRLEGHIVQGHVDGVGEILKVSEDSEFLKVRYPPSFRVLIVEKGSIAVDGVSLTITHIDGTTFSAALIPQTLKETTLGQLKEGDSVNLETDVIGKYRQQLMAK